MDDFALLRQYVEQGSQDAFAELVRRHVGLVYSSALRQLRDPHDAEDVSQAVFMTLARDAAKLGRRQVLAGWLMTATRYLASHARQSQSRRRNHERKAAELAGAMKAMNAVNAMNDTREAGERSVASDGWERIAPELDEALAELAPKARDAVLLRYFQDQSVGEVARNLGISEDAAKRRLSRALGQLRGAFRRRGVIVTAAALAALLPAHTVHAAPPGLADAATAASLRFAAHVSTKAATAAALQKGAVSLMAAIKSKAVALSALALAFAGATGAVVHHVMARPAAPVVLAADTAPPVAPVADKNEPSWRKRFDEVYRLGEGEVLRRVPPPFIPERAAYFGEADTSGMMLDPTADSLTVFNWTGVHAELDHWVLGKPTVATVLGNVMGLPSYKVEMPLKDRLRPLPGDWVVRKDATEEKNMQALAGVLRDELKWKVRFEKREAEHDVIVATGAFTKPKDSPEGLVDVYVDAKSARGASAGDVGALLRNMGERCNTEIIDETKAAGDAKQGVFWRNHGGGNLSPEDADKMLANVAAQTGLHFQRAKRTTAHWVAVTEAKAK